MNPVTTLRTGAIMAGLAVALGAFGAHGLEGRVTPARLATFETAVRYLMYHGIGLLLIGLLRPALKATAPVMLAGTAIFSGSLFLLVLTDASWLGAVAPVGGALMIAGWLMLAFGVRRS